MLQCAVTADPAHVAPNGAKKHTLRSTINMPLLRSEETQPASCQENRSCRFAPQSKPGTLLLPLHYFRATNSFASSSSGRTVSE